MVKNWTAAEAAQVLVEGTDTASIRDIGHRFPSFAYLVVKLGSSAMDVFSVIPEAITARKFDSWLKGPSDTKSKVDSEDDEDEEEKEKPKKKGKRGRPAKKSKPADDDDDDDEDEDEDDDDDFDFD